MLSELRQQWEKCTRCGLCGGRARVVPGRGNERAAIMLVGQNPGADENQKGLPFVGPAGKVLAEALKQAGVVPESVYITNVVHCLTPDNRKPGQFELDACRAYVDAEIAVVNPRVLVLLGSVASGLVGQADQKMGLIRGKFWDYCGKPCMVTYHPAAVLRNRDLMGALILDIKAVAEKVAADPVTAAMAVFPGSEIL